MANVSSKSASPGMRMTLDYGPLLVFFAVFFAIPGGAATHLVAIATHSLSAKDQLSAIIIARTIVATGAFILATIAAMLISVARLGSISPMLWISGILVVVFGGLTIWFADPAFIQMKPTFVYGAFALVLIFGIITGRPLLQGLMGTAYPGLSDLGWRKLTVNWAIFFAAMALANEVARHVLTLPEWVLYKFPGCAIIAFVFALANIPMLMRHGLNIDEKSETTTRELPPE
jgi:intracellular septation protein